MAITSPVLCDHYTAYASMQCAFHTQDPIVFSGTVRYNLNPFGGEAADSDMWAALQQAGLKETVSSLAVRLYSCQPCMKAQATHTVPIPRPQQCLT